MKINMYQVPTLGLDTAKLIGDQLSVKCPRNLSLDPVSLNHIGHRFPYPFPKNTLKEREQVMYNKLGDCNTIQSVYTAATGKLSPCNMDLVNIFHLTSCLFVCALQLVVHVGVSGMATTVTLEKCGHNRGYSRVDNCDFCPKSGCCMEGGPDCMSSVIDMEVVCKRVNSSDLGVSVSVSRDAGRYAVNM